jgi:hypothetical protein
MYTLHHLTLLPLKTYNTITLITIYPLKISHYRLLHISHFCPKKHLAPSSIKNISIHLRFCLLYISLLHHRHLKTPINFSQEHLVLLSTKDIYCPLKNLNYCPSRNSNLPSHKIIISPNCKREKAI